jgi:hypothetical protein
VKQSTAEAEKGEQQGRFPPKFPCSRVASLQTRAPRPLIHFHRSPSIGQRSAAQHRRPQITREVHTLKRPSMLTAAVSQLQLPAVPGRASGNCRRQGSAPCQPRPQWRHCRHASRRRLAPAAAATSSEDDSPVEEGGFCMPAFITAGRSVCLAACVAVWRVHCPAAAASAHAGSVARRPPSSPVAHRNCCPHLMQTTSAAPASQCWMSRSETTQVRLPALRRPLPPA